MKRLRNYLVGVDHGEVVLFSDFEHDGVMWTGQGPRQTRAVVMFAEAFKSPPVVTCWLTMWDVSNETIARMDIQAEDVTDRSAALVFRTWGETKVARVRVSWQAIGELPHDDDWNID